MTFLVTEELSCGIGQLQNLDRNPFYTIEGSICFYLDYMFKPGRLAQGLKKGRLQNITHLLKSIPNIIIFSDRTNNNGQLLYKFIQKNKLGKVFASKPVVNPNSLNIIQLWVWELDKKNLAKLLTKSKAIKDFVILIGQSQ